MNAKNKNGLFGKKLSAQELAQRLGAPQPQRVDLNTQIQKVETRAPKSAEKYGVACAALVLALLIGAPAHADDGGVRKDIALIRAGDEDFRTTNTPPPPQQGYPDNWSDAPEDVQDRLISEAIQNQEMDRDWATAIANTTQSDFAGFDGSSAATDRSAAPDTSGEEASGGGEGCGCGCRGGCGCGGCD